MIFRSRKRRAREDDNGNGDNVSRDNSDGDNPDGDNADGDNADGEDSTGDRSGRDRAEDHDDASGSEEPPEQTAAEDDARTAAGAHGAEERAAGQTDTADRDATVAIETADAVLEDGAAEADSDEELGDLSDAEMDEMDAQDWRELGPYDIGEVDAAALEEAAGEGDHVDLGSMLLPSLQDVELRLQVDEDSQQIVSAMMVLADSALEVGAFAAPRSGGLWPEIRPELISSVIDNGGSANLVEGPYGVELRRLIPVQTPDGEEGYQPSRMWIAEGPRWMLRGIVYGEAALTDGTESPVAELLDLFRQVVVRRGDEAMAPGDLLPLTVPEALTDSGADADDAEDDDTTDGAGPDSPGHGPSEASDRT